MKEFEKTKAAGYVKTAILLVVFYVFYALFASDSEPKPYTPSNATLDRACRWYKSEALSSGADLSNDWEYKLIVSRTLDEFGIRKFRTEFKSRCNI